MKRFSERQALSTVSEINVTPLIDLAFVLLIIFMITTPLLQSSIELEAPTSAAAETRLDPKKVQVVSIDKFENVLLGEDKINLEELEAQLRAQQAQGKTQAVLVRPHKELPVQKFVQVMDALQRAGITRSGVIVLPEEK